MGIGQVAKHPRRGPTTSYDAAIVRFPQNAPHERAAHVDDVRGAPEAVRVLWVEGSVGTQVTMLRASLGDRMSEHGFVRALAEVIGDPPGWLPSDAVANAPQPLLPWVDGDDPPRPRRRRPPPADNDHVVPPPLPAPVYPDAVPHPVDVAHLASGVVEPPPPPATPTGPTSAGGPGEPPGALRATMAGSGALVATLTAVPATDGPAPTVRPEGIEGEANFGAIVVRAHPPSATDAPPVPTSTDPPAATDADPLVVTCTGCGNPLPLTEHTPRLATSPPCPICIPPRFVDGHEILGGLEPDEEPPESGPYRRFPPADE